MTTAMTVIAAWPILLAVLVPLGLLALFAFSASLDGSRRLLPLASLPALLVALLPGAPLDLSAVLLGLRLEADAIARTLLLLIGLAWTAAAWFAADRLDDRFRSFALCWLAALGGIVIAALAADLATFYTGYVVMTFAAYGLVIHERDPAALRAGRIYLVLALAGEALLLAGLLLIGAALGNADLDTLPAAMQGQDTALAATLVLAGFAVKIGVVPVHLWLPLAHSVAPVPASAILSGVLVKAGLLGALRIVPAEPFANETLVMGLVALGLFTALYGVVMGLSQQRLKTVLAYSTVSQMGLLFAALALALPPGAQRGGPLLAVLVLHHGLNKAALFLAAGSLPGASRWRLGLLALPALAIAGLPFTTGDLAKGLLKDALYGGPMAAWAVPMITLGSLATALLMLRVFSLVRSGYAGEPGAKPPPLHPAWSLLVVLGFVVPWLQAGVDGVARVPDAPAVWAALWPPLLALALALAWQRLGRPSPRWRVPEGDLLVPVVALLDIAARFGSRVLGAGAAARDRIRRWRDETSAEVARQMAARVEQIESSLAALPVAGLVVLSLAAVLGWALAG